MPFIGFLFANRRTKLTLKTALFSSFLFVIGLVFLILTASGAYDGGTRSRTFVIVASSIVTAIGLSYLGFLTYNTLYPPEDGPGQRRLPGHLGDRQQRAAMERQGGYQAEVR